MRRLLAMLTMLAGIGTLLLNPQSFKTVAQPQGVLWVNDSAGSGKGIYQLPIDGGNPQLLIPTEKFVALGANGALMAASLQGQIFLLDSVSKRILKATADGQVSVILKNLRISNNPTSFAVDADGNFIIGESDNSLLKVDLQGKATQVTKLCSTSIGAIASIAVDKTGLYIVALNCAAPQLLSVTPSGEVAVIVDGFPEFEGRFNSLNDVLMDPNEAGYWVAASSDVLHISPSGEVISLQTGWPAIGMAALATSPAGDLFALYRFNNEVIRFYADGARQVLFRAALVAPQGVEWVAQGSDL